MSDTGQQAACSTSQESVDPAPSLLALSGVVVALLLESGALDFCAVLVLIAALTGLAAVIRPDLRICRSLAGRRTLPLELALLGLAAGFFQGRLIVQYATPVAGLRLIFAAAVAVLALLTVLWLWRDWRPFWLCALLLVAVVGSVAHTIPTGVDVFSLHREAAHALLTGRNPYAITYTDPYTGADDLRYYGKGLTQGGRILVGYPYPPVSLLLVCAGSLLGDPRWISVMAVGAATLVALTSSADRTRRGIAAGLVLFPGLFRLLTGGFTEAHVVLLLVLVVVAAQREWRATPYLLGALFVSKQYFIVCVPLLVLLLPLARRHPRGLGGFAGRCCLSAAVLTLPWLVWSPHGFWSSLVALQFRQPLRPDSISLLVSLVRHTGWPPHSVYGILPVAVGLGAAVLLARWAPRTPAAFAGSMAVVLALTFLVSKQAFANYYYLVASAFLVSAALWEKVSTAGTAAPSDGTRETPEDTARTNHMGVFRPLS